MALFGVVGPADEGGEGGVEEHRDGDVDVDGAFDEADDKRPAPGFLAAAVVGRVRR